MRTASAAAGRGQPRRGKTRRPKDEDEDAAAATKKTATVTAAARSTSPSTSSASSFSQTKVKATPNQATNTFAALGLVDVLREAVDALQWKAPTPIQTQSIPLALQGKDIIGLAETGAGKTAAFTLPILQRLLQKPTTMAALMLAPTRELAFQIGEQVNALGSGIGVRCVVVVGGVSMTDQAIALAKKPHVIVATPGRIVDHLENTRGFHLRELRFLVLDEADRLLKMDFEKEIDKLLEAIPHERQTFLFSATMTSQVAKLQRACLTSPERVEVNKKYQTVAGLLQQYLFVPDMYKEVYLAFLLNELAGQSSIIFTATCEHTQRVALVLRNLGFRAVPLHGQMQQPKRLAALNRFKNGEASILVATDVASRGIDIPNVDLVVNFDIPTNSKDYIHRVGRTARAGRSGRAVTIVTQYDVSLFQRIEQLIGKKMDLYATEANAVMVMAERVAEAHRIAQMQIRERGYGGGKKKRGRETAGLEGGDADGEEDDAFRVHRSRGKKGGNKKHKRRRQ